MMEGKEAMKEGKQDRIERQAGWREINKKIKGMKEEREEGRMEDKLKKKKQKENERMWMKRKKWINKERDNYRKRNEKYEKS